MSDPFEDLKNTWKTSQKSVGTVSENPDTLIKMAEKKKKSTLRMHVLNILVLALVLTGISAFFVYVARFEQLISHIGVALMTGGLAIRILIELYSIYLSTKIDLSDTTLKANTTFLEFYQFRKRIHGPVTITILVLYTIGFYLLTPEFNDYFTLPMMVIIDLSYIPAAIIFTWNIRNAIRREMNYLNEILRLQKDMTSTI